MDIVIRAAIIFAFVFLLTRLLGRRELNSLEPFDLILLVVTGDLVQQGVTQNDQSLTGAMLAISTIGLLTVALSYPASASNGCARSSTASRSCWSRTAR